MQELDLLKQQINEQINATHYVKITVFPRGGGSEESKLAEIQGVVTSGSINVNGDSSVRRTGSLSMVATLVDGKEIFNVTDIKNLISIEKEIKVEIGLDNQSIKDISIGEIYWYPQGHFIISSASVSHTPQNITISINLKDKMALLNGECGGMFTTGVIHSPMYVEQENGEFAKEPALFTDLIKTILTEYSYLKEDQIIIKDIPQTIKNIVRWTGSYPVYSQAILGENNSFNALELLTIQPASGRYDTYTFGDSIGYVLTSFVYPTENELSSNAGETITSVLDKIKNTLGNYEYFFDLDGNFVFQKIQSYLDEGLKEDNLSEAIINGFDYLTSPSGKSVYNFANNALVSAFNNNPKYEAIKNDIYVWGIRGDSKAAIQYHLVIDNIPSYDKREIETYFYTDPYDSTIVRMRKKGKQQEGDKTGSIKINDYRTHMYYDYMINGENSQYKDYGKELEENWPKIYDLEKGQFKIEAFQDSKVFLNNMPYFFEIIDPKNKEGVSLLENLKVSNIGRRTKVINDDKINTLLAPAPPNWVFIEAGMEETAEARLKALFNKENFVQLAGDLARNVSLGAFTNAAYDTARAMLHEVIGYNESISITTVPLYFLEPNTIITIKDTDIGVKEADYIIKSFNIPLDSKGTMTIQCNKALSRI